MKPPRKILRPNYSRTESDERHEHARLSKLVTEAKAKRARETEAQDC